MSLIHNKIVEVQTDPAGRPVAFFWRGRWKQVIKSVLKRSRPTANTLFPDPDAVRFQCQTEQGIVCDLARIGEVWVLERTWD
ncbi:MAG: hypothetical protein QHH02_05265 [Syntrophomonadaceae bacterium]|nr:hypothetical protein [Syntrophomonadaceae bacterium]